MTNILSVKTALVLLLSTTMIVHTFAQKLPNKQEGSLLAPAGVKIDGKPSEWTYKAFNKATDVYYAIANDKDNLYLTIKVEDPGIVRKIVSAGITFSVNSSGKRSDNNTASVTYPVFNYKTRPYINFKDKATDSGIDSFVLANNKRFAAQSKFIRTAGIQQIDTLISAYNSDGIRAAAAFDNQMNYTYELAISLKHLKPAMSADDKLFYRVMLNAIKMDDMPGVNITRDASGTILSITVEKRDAMPNSNSAAMGADTDFSDEYILAK